MKSFRITKITAETVTLFGKGRTKTYVPIKQFIKEYGNPKLNQIISK